MIAIHAQKLDDLEATHHSLSRCARGTNNGKVIQIIPEQDKTGVCSGRETSVTLLGDLDLFCCFSLDHWVTFQWPVKLLHHSTRSTFSLLPQIYHNLTVQQPSWEVWVGNLWGQEINWIKVSHMFSEGLNHTELLCDGEPATFSVICISQEISHSSFLVVCLFCFFGCCWVGFVCLFVLFF